MNDVWYVMRHASVCVNSKMVSLMIVGVIVGALSVIVVQALAILYIIHRLIGPGPTSKSPKLLVRAHPTTSPLSQNQGILWVLDPEKHPKIPAADQSKKRDTVEVAPVRKLAKVKDGMLILIEADGSVTEIILKGCKVVAVSATSLPTRKWAKRYPIKVESKDGAVYQGSKILYIFAETSWEKESWCKALRLASSDNKERLLWFSKITEEFRGYLKSLSDSYPFLIKPSAGYQLGHLDKANRFDDPPSKVRQLWRKLSKKTSLASIDEKRIADRCHVSQDHTSLLRTTKHALPGKMQNDCEEDSSSSASCRSGSSAHASENHDAETADKCVIDEGTLCWNLLVSRLFFDAKNNLDIRNSLKARIQRSLSTMRIPTYIGEVTCTDVDPGNLPPYIHGMRAVPIDMNDVWAMEMDIEYSGGVALYIETRLECELDLPNGIKDHNIKSTDLLENFKHLQEDFELSDGKNSSSEQKDSEDPKLEMLRTSRANASMPTSSSRWKSLLNYVAKHVSQVPLTLTIRVATLRGTIQLHMKPPPSDQIWFGFTCMPDIQFQLESSVKDHKVTNGHVASFLINRFKASIRETLVLPNCESMGVSWMLAEKDDWVPRNVAPLMWLNREAPADTFSNESTDKRTEDTDLENKRGKQKRIDPGNLSINEVSNGQVESSITTTLQRSSSESSLPSHDLNVPLLQNEEARNMGIIQSQDNPECHLPSSYVSLREERSNLEDDDGKLKWLGRKARMLDLGKKMGEKLEEKRRHIEERSRHIVEKMRGP